MMKSKFTAVAAAASLLAMPIAASASGPVRPGAALLAGTSSISGLCATSMQGCVLPAVEVVPPVVQAPVPVVEVATPAPKAFPLLGLLGLAAAAALVLIALGGDDEPSSPGGS